MTEELEKRLLERWPSWFKPDSHAGVFLGFDHRDGWFDLVWRLCESIEPLVAGLKVTGGAFEVVRVKQKFGGLRFQAASGNDAIDSLIDSAEAESFLICEACGQRGSFRHDIVQTLCDVHFHLFTVSRTK